jgi:hypothetical protein
MVETQHTGGPPDKGTPPNKRKKISWKSILGSVVALVIVWQLVHAFTQGHGKNSGGPPAASSPTSKPTPTPTVTLRGHRVPAGGGPVIALNPGLVAPGGQVGVGGSGFAARTSVTVLLRTSHSGRGRVVGHGHTTGNGSLTTGFTMPTTVSSRTATVVVQQSGGPQATAQLVTPGGMGTAKIVGKAAGKPGDTVTVTASGFGPGERINVYWGRISGTPATTLTADGSGSLSQASVPVGVAPVGPTTLVLVGQKTHTTATVPYQMLGLYPNTSAHPYAIKAGKPVSFSGSGFAPSEQILIYLNASSGTPAMTINSNGAGTFSVNFVVPFGLKGSQSLTAIGEQSRASVTSGFDVLPYTPTGQASTYSALPGTTVSFYATGFAPNEVVLVYAGGGRGGGGQLVTAFRVDGRGSASAAGQYMVPSGVGPAVSFRLVGQKSGGSTGAKVSVGAASGPVTIPSQKPYVLPPSLGGKPPPSHSPKSNSPSAPTSGNTSQQTTSGP